MGEQKTLICIMNKHTAYTIVESVTEEEWNNILKEQYAKAVKKIVCPTYKGPASLKNKKLADVPGAYIEEDENGGYTTTSKYESIYVKESDDIIINENTLLNNGPISFTQNIVSKGYNIECHINNATIDKKEKLYQFESINIDNPEEGVTIKFSKMIDREDNSIFKRSLEASCKLDGKLYTIVNGLFDIYTKVSVGNIMDDNQLEDLIEVNVKSVDNSELVEYISDKLKEYIDKNEDLKSLLSISKVIISL